MKPRGAGSGGGSKDRAAGRGASYRILLFPKDVITDEPRVSLLRRKSVEVRAARSSKQALSFAVRWKPQLLVFSSRLEDTTAVRFCEAVRSREELDGTKLLMITDQLDEEMDNAFLAGVDAHLINPVESEQLIKTMAGMLNVRLRSASRVDVDLLGQASFLGRDPSGDVGATVNIMNLSETGILLESPVVLQVGSIGRLQFFIPGSSKQMSLYCCVRMLSNELSLHYGVEFIGLAAAEREMLREFVMAEGARADGVGQ